MLRLIDQRRTATFRWPSTFGTVEKFSYGGDGPEVLHRYQVNGQEYLGRAMIAGPIPGKGLGGDVPERFWVREDGSLRFPTGASTEVYYNPDDPSDAVLVQGGNLGWWKAGLPLMVAAVMWGIFYVIVYRQEEIRFVAGGIGLLLCWALGRAIVEYRRRYKQAASFETTVGCLTRAEVVRWRGRRGGSTYLPAVEYRYEVNGVTYFCRQISMQKTQWYGPRSRAESTITELKQREPLEVYYDPQRPWDAFLLK